MAKETAEKRPRGRPPAGAVLVDGKWQPTELSIRVAAERLLQYREHSRTRHRETRELFRKSHLELFVRGDSNQTKLTAEVRSTEQNGDLRQYQRRDNTSSTSDSSCSKDAIASAIGNSLLWSPQQRDGIPSVPRGPASI